jgi:hypothetical protein
MCTQTLLVTRLKLERDCPPDRVRRSRFLAIDLGGVPTLQSCGYLRSAARAHVQLEASSLFFRLEPANKPLCGKDHVVTPTTKTALPSRPVVIKQFVTAR